MFYNFLSDFVFLFINTLSRAILVEESLKKEKTKEKFTEIFIIYFL